MVQLQIVSAHILPSGQKVSMFNGALPKRASTVGEHHSDATQPSCGCPGCSKCMSIGLL